MTRFCAQFSLHVFSFLSILTYLAVFAGSTPQRADILAYRVGDGIRFADFRHRLSAPLLRDMFVFRHMAWSPDGATLAYTTTDDDAPPYISLLRLDNHQSRFLVSGDMPRWSPDGTHLLFVGILDGQWGS